MHEYTQVYYENLYANSDYEIIIKVVDYLSKNRYNRITELYVLSAVDCERYQYG